MHRSLIITAAVSILITGSAYMLMNGNLVCKVTTEPLNGFDLATGATTADIESDCLDSICLIDLTESKPPTQIFRFHPTMNRYTDSEYIGMKLSILLDDRQ